MTSRPVSKIVFLLAASAVAGAGIASFVQQHRDGYTDSPLIPGQTWHVNDSNRPYPPAVVPGFLGGAPSDAIRLFDGTDMSQWCQLEHNDLNGAEVTPKWGVVDHVIEVNGGTGNLYTKQKFGDCQLHVEWQEPKNIGGSGQGRGNSGVFLQSRYEVQVLDSYRAPTYADGQAGAIYGEWPPLVNPQTAPGTWQTYDIIFQAPRFDGDKLVSPAYETVFFNGVIVHNHTALTGPTAHRSVENYSPVDAGPERLYLQDHGGGVGLRFRNIWIRPIRAYDQG